MKTIKRVPVTFERVEFMPAYELFEENVIYISDKFEVSIHRCLCGCGSKTVMPLGKGNWNYSIDNDKLTMSPSVGNYQMPCKSHYIITNGGANFV